MKLAQQVVDAINQAADDSEWPVKFTAERRTFPIRSIDELKATQVSVFEGPRSSVRLSRGEWSHTKIIFVAIQKKLEAGSPTHTTEVDELVELLETIEAFFEASATGDYDPYEFSTFDESTDRLPFSAALLQTDSTYAAIVGLEFTD